MSHWTTYQPKDDVPWNIARVVHLHRRAAFGANWAEIQRDLESGPAEAVERLVRADRHVDNEFEKMSSIIGDAAAASNNRGRLRAWWFYRMLFSPDPLGERLTLVWHNHFATSTRKVDNLIWMHEQNEVFRSGARGPFGELLANVVKHPAMLKWLDADANRKGQPNENLARELMELFTLGIGYYSEADVKAAARALTGWAIRNDQFSYRPARHDDSDLSLFGYSGPMDGDALLQRLVEHPATPKRLAWRLCDAFFGEGVCESAAIEELAALLAEQKLNIEPAVETILRSELFFSDRNIRTRIASPAAHVAGAIRILELTAPPPSTLQLGDWCSRMGQDLFNPPNVSGWKGGRAWLGTRAVVARANFANSIATGALWRSTEDTVESRLETLASKYGIAGRKAQLHWLQQLLVGHDVDIAKAELQPPQGLSQFVGKWLGSASTQLV